jgi:hypothetical protein
MGILAPNADERVRDVRIEDDALSVALMDGRTISVPLALDRAAIKPRLTDTNEEQRANREIAGAGYGVHRPDVDEDPSTEGLLQGAPVMGTLGLFGRAPLTNPRPRLACKMRPHDPKPFAASSAIRDTPCPDCQQSAEPSR